MEYWKNWKEIPHMYLDIILSQYPKEYNIPTEVVISEPGVVSPKKGRYWHTEMYVDDDKMIFRYISYEDLRQRYEGKKFMGTSGYENVLVYELWSNGGEDGHVVFYPHGYIFGTIGEIEAFCDKEGYFCHTSKQRYYP